MNNNFPEDRNVRELWQSQKTQGVHMSVEQIRLEAGKFERRIRIRNLEEYVAAIAMILFFTWEFTRARGELLVQAGFGLMIAGTSYLVWHLLTKGSPGAMVGDVGRANWIEFRRAELVRQRDLLGTIWRWYLGPLIPGLVVLVVAFARFSLSHLPHPGPLIAMDVFLMVAVFLVVAKINKRAARKLQGKIDELDQQSRD